MKRFFAIILSICLIVSMTACQSSSKKKTTTVSSNTTAQSKKENSNTTKQKDDSSTTKKVEQRTDCDFRNAKWGDTKEDVKKYELEIEDFIDTPDGDLGGETSVAGYPAYAIFIFDNDRLYQATYAFDLNYTNGGQYILTYTALKNGLMEKYGNPTDDSIIPLTNELLIEAAGEADALKLGYVQYGTTWETSRTRIQLVMASQNYKMTLAIVYSDKNYSGPSNNGL